MNDFENEDTLDGFELEITDLDPDREKRKTPALWLNAQRLWSQRRHWITLFMVVGITILILTLSSPLLPPFSHSTQHAPGAGASHSLAQPIPCSSAETIITVQSNESATMNWYKAKQSSGAAPAGAGSGSCVHSSISIQMVPGSNGIGRWKFKK